ncbi:DUF4145 domain-containing protein [Streptomyces sp. NPDC057621]|uniref:DUF4145 domain-containing protein n=1 Tax=Streptomyces sp. NPDC057621 TaxID=3346186 RepID=UPI0036981954
MTNRFQGLDGFGPLGRSLAGECPHCVRHTTLKCVSHLKLDGSGVEREDLRMVRSLMSLRCDWCKKDSAFLRLSTVELKKSQSGTSQTFVTVDLEQVWPNQAPRELPPEAPEVVREVFAEAALAEAAGAFRLAGVGYRAVVEQIVKERGAVGGSLFERITGLTVLGASQDIVDAFHEVRFVGNDAAHDALAYSSEEIADIAELIKEAVLVLYVQPAQRVNMAAQRAARRAAAKQTAP